MGKRASFSSSADAGRANERRSRHRQMPEEQTTVVLVVGRCRKSKRPSFLSSADTERANDRRSCRRYLFITPFWGRVCLLSGPEQFQLQVTARVEISPKKKDGSRLKLTPLFFTEY
jgi:hypothetical protein